jgi:hypothetical protein
VLPVVKGLGCNTRNAQLHAKCLGLVQVLCVAATKADIPNRKVTEKEGREWAATRGFPFFEVSSWNKYCQTETLGGSGAWEWNDGSCQVVEGSLLVGERDVHVM